MWGGHPKSCGLGLDTYFRIHSHQLIFDLPCYSALLSVPIWHTTSFHSLSIFFSLCTERKLKYGKQQKPFFFTASLIAHVGKEKEETSCLCHSQCCASSHTSTQFLLSVFLKRDWSPHCTHRQKKWIMTPASRALVIASEVTVSKWACGPLLIFTSFKVPCKTPSKVPKSYFNPCCLPFLLATTATCHLLYWCLAQCWELLLAPW